MRKKNSFILLICILCLLISLAFTGGVFYSTRMLDSQYEYLRWQGEGPLPFCQFTCCMALDGKLALKDIYQFRTDMVNAFAENSIEFSSGYGFTDCWSAEGSVKIYGERNNGTASVIAVGGSFFAFHPQKLLNGSYISETDLMRDNILLDEDLAWLLFGGSDLEGMTVHIFGMPFRIAGVIARENDYASRKAYTGGLGLYMSYDSYLDLSGEEGFGVTCYEVCIPNPVRNFAQNLIQAKFPIGSGEIVENSGRFTLSRLLRALINLPSRSMNSAAFYPYWENAARYAETSAALMLLFAAVFGVVPVTALLLLLIRLLGRAKEKLSDDILPGISENAEEAIRKRQRSRWEKKHPR